VAVVRSAENVRGGRWAGLPILRGEVSVEGWAIGTEVGGTGGPVVRHFGKRAGRDGQDCPSYNSITQAHTSGNGADGQLPFPSSEACCAQDS
jgi:hypothetical protein